jgi:hypothetical protein
MQKLKIKMDANMKIINEMNKAFERWKVIDDYDSYSVSTFGRVRNDTTGKVLKGRSVNSDGYRLAHIQGTCVKIHRLVANAFINNPNNKKCVDHKDNNKVNNNITNLRWATHTENNINASMRKDNISGIKGVSWCKQQKKWRAQIQIDGLKIHLGCFDDIEDAKKARITRANQAFGIYINACENK